MKAIFLVFLLSVSAFGVDQTINERENFFETSTPYQITPHVNPVTGDLLEEESDLIVAGCEPLSVRRFYSHTSIYEPRSGGWRFNPETYMIANFELTEQEILAAVGDSNGCISVFKPSSTPYSYKFDAKGYIHFNPSGQNHPLNIAVNYHKVKDPKNKNYFGWNGEVIDGSGRRRLFGTRYHPWLSTIITDTHRRGHDIYMTCITPNVWTPYQLPVYEERLPNGNIICYSYIKWKKDKEFPRPILLSKITAYNADRTKELGTLQFTYSQDKWGNVKGILATGSDGRQAQFHLNGKKPILLTSVNAPDQPTVQYSYQGTSINQVARPEGRLITTEYNSAGKVSAQYAPVGTNGELCPIGRYEYQNNQITIVYDAENNKTIYHLDTNKKIIAIELYKDHLSYHITRFLWDEATGNLIRKTVEDSNRRPIHITEYRYDANHNPIEEKIGDGTQWHTIYRTYSTDGFNLKLTESDRADKVIHYSYIPNTNLLNSELVYEKDKICKRIFHTYDRSACCIKTITDDGKSADPNDIQDVSFRTITKIQPKQESPCLGLPEVIEEKTIDSSGNEILLSKVVYAYAPSGKILKEEHYDATNTRRYTLLNQYDKQERLISKTDALGNQTSFTYDDNNNLTSITGPRQDQHKEIAYDKANRPIRISEWQTDGTILTMHKEYNKLGQLIVETDPYGFKTQYFYNALGQNTATIYPDGSTEQKEYDLLGHIIKETDANGYATCRTNNYAGKPLAISYPDGTEEHFTYNTTGTLATHTDKNGTQTHYTYDIFDNPITTKIYSSANQLLKTTTATHTPFAQLTATSASGVTTTYTYDFCGRKQCEEIEGNKIYYFYDPLGQQHQIKTEDAIHTNLYNEKGEVIEKRTEDLQGNLIIQEKYRYDPAGNCNQKITPYGTFTTEYDTRGQIIKKIDPLGHASTKSYNQLTSITVNPHHITTTRTYDARGNEIEFTKTNKQHNIIAKIAKVYDPCCNLLEEKHHIYKEGKEIGVQTNRYAYGPQNRLESQTESDRKQTQFIYDKTGRLFKKIKPDGTTHFHEYDALGRLSHYYGPDFDQTYTYDQEDRLIKVLDKLTKTQTEREYDRTGHLICEKLANGLNIETQYDLQGKKIATKVADASPITYTYHAGLLHTITYRNQTHTYQTRDLQANITQVSLPNQLGSLTFQRDAYSRPISFQSPYYEAINAYDPMGNLSSQTFTDPLGTETITYSYDDHEQLTHEQNHHYIYDSLNNRHHKDGHDYQINDLSQIVDEGYTYDANGNLLSNGYFDFTYDSQDRLINIKKNRLQITFTYDPFHRRISKTTNNEKQLYLWDQENEIGAANSKGKLTQLRILGEGLAAEIGAAVFIELDQKVYIPIHDHRGNLVLLIDKKPIETYRYSAFGEEQTKATLSPWRFSSKRVDPETHYLYFGRRYYSPSLGRWITPDPQGLADGPNLYAYLHNNPLIFCDPFGLWRNPFVNTAISRTIFSGIHFTGKNLIPHPYLSDYVEAIGRWGLGGNFFERADYRKNYSRIETIPGRKAANGIPGYFNGMLNPYKEAYADAKKMSELYGGAEFTLFYDQSKGFIKDLYGALFSKLGFPTQFERECANFFKEQSANNPNLEFNIIAHSRGCTRMNNMGKLLMAYNLGPKIKVDAIAPATITSKDNFKEVTNYVNNIDPVSMTNPLAYIKARLGYTNNVKFLKANSWNPLKEHAITSPVNWEVVADLGDKFQKQYFHE